MGRRLAQHREVPEQRITTLSIGFDALNRAARDKGLSLFSGVDHFDEEENLRRGIDGLCFGERVVADSGVQRAPRNKVDRASEVYASGTRWHGLIGYAEAQPSRPLRSGARGVCARGADMELPRSRITLRGIGSCAPRQ